MSGFYDFDEIRSTYPILDVCKCLLEAELKEDGPNKYRGACPFCGDKRSFRVTTNAGNHGHGMAGCFKCGPKGDCIAVVAKKYGVKANEAVKLIVEKLGKSTVPGNSTVTSSGGTSIPLDKVIARLEYEHEDVQALGLTPEIAKSLGIGFLRSGTLPGRVLFPLFKDGALAGFVGYAPDLEPPFKFPKNLIETNVVRFPKTG